MILPIYLLGTTELRQPTEEVNGNSDELQKLVGDMLETMEEAKGIGLAAPQVGRTERLFVVDVSAILTDHFEPGEVIPDQPMVFINPTVLDESDELVTFEEGCLSIPDVHEEIDRPDQVRIQYLDRQLRKQIGEFNGMLARVVQHEYDHVEGILFIDHISAFRRRLLKRRLRDITEGIVEAEYPVFIEGKGVAVP